MSLITEKMISFTEVSTDDANIVQITFFSNIEGNKTLNIEGNKSIL